MTKVPSMVKQPLYCWIPDWWVIPLLCIDQMMDGQWLSRQSLPKLVEHPLWRWGKAFSNIEHQLELAWNRWPPETASESQPWSSYLFYDTHTLGMLITCRLWTLCFCMFYSVLPFHSYPCGSFLHLSMTGLMSPFHSLGMVLFRYLSLFMPLMSPTAPWVSVNTAVIFCLFSNLPNKTLCPQKAVTTPLHSQLSHALRYANVPYM